jgi:hypothetical protein
MSDAKPTVIDAQAMNPPAAGWTVQSQALTQPTSIGYDVEGPAEDDEGARTNEGTPAKPRRVPTQVVRLTGRHDATARKRSVR